jgi:hypothetical protein
VTPSSSATTSGLTTTQLLSACLSACLSVYLLFVFLSHTLLSLGRIIIQLCTQLFTKRIYYVRMLEWQRTLLFGTDLQLALSIVPFSFSLASQQVSWLSIFRRRESIHNDESTKTRLASDVAMTDELTFRYPLSSVFSAVCCLLSAVTITINIVATITTITGAHWNYPGSPFSPRIRNLSMLRYYFTIVILALRYAHTIVTLSSQ